MQVTCAGCGAFNRAGAKYCAVCGAPLPAAPPTALPLRSATPAQPQQPQPPQPRPAPPPPAVQMPGPALFQTAPIVEGKVKVVDQERQEKAPFDPARAMVMLALIVSLLAFFAGMAAAGLTLGILLLILGIGVGVLGCLFSFVLMPLQMMLGPVINAIRGERTVSVLNFQVADAASGVPVDVLLYRKPGSGNVRVGDGVQVFGSVQRGSNVVRARRVRVTESGGVRTDYRIEALRPWPIWVGLAVWGAALGGVLYALGAFR